MPVVYCQCEVIEVNAWDLHAFDVLTGSAWQGAGQHQHLQVVLELCQQLDVCLRRRVPLPPGLLQLPLQLLNAPLQLDPLKEAHLRMRASRPAAPAQPRLENRSTTVLSPVQVLHGHLIQMLGQPCGI